MSKSVLIIDTPTCCAECDLYDYVCGDGVCFPDYIVKNAFIFSPFEGRMPECPLIPLEKVCKMVIDTYKKEEKIKKENTILCDECYKFFDKREIKTITEYSKWFTDVNKEGYKTDWRYVYNRGKCPYCGELVLIEYHTERKEDNAD